MTKSCWSETALITARTRAAAETATMQLASLRRYTETSLRLPKSGPEGHALPGYDCNELDARPATWPKIRMLHKFLSWYYRDGLRRCRASMIGIFRKAVSKINCYLADPSDSKQTFRDPTVSVVALSDQLPEGRGRRLTRKRLEAQARQKQQCLLCDRVPASFLEWLLTQADFVSVGRMKSRRLGRTTSSEYPSPSHDH